MKLLLFSLLLPIPGTRCSLDSLKMYELKEVIATGEVEPKFRLNKLNSDGTSFFITNPLQT